MPTPEEVIAYCDRRLAAVSSCKAKIETILKAEPSHPQGAGMRKRLAEYAESLEGLPLMKAQAQLQLRQRAAKQNRAGDHEIVPPAVGRER